MSLGQFEGMVAKGVEKRSNARSVFEETLLSLRLLPVSFLVWFRVGLLLLSFTIDTIYYFTN